MSSLATRCTACGTVFKVVQDQLKVSKGWVRCGRCDTVFNALEELFELNGDTIIGGVRQPVVRPTLPELPQQQARTDVIDTNETSSQRSSDVVHEPASEPVDANNEFSRSPFSPHRKSPDQTPSDLVKHRDRNEFADAQFDSDLMTEENTPTADNGSSAKSQVDYTPPQPSGDTPAFVRHADRLARWKSPRVRWLLSLASLFMVVSLALQATHHWRERLAAEIPASAPYLAHWCGWLSCQIEPYRSIKDITVESSALNRLSQNNHAYRLSVTLRNRGHLTLKMPSVDLSVNDGAGQLLARRTLHPADFQTRLETVAANSEVTLAVVLKSTNPRVNGYTVEMFYP